MNLQVLVSTMNQTNHNLIHKMNIRSDAIVVNQCNINKFEDFEYKRKKIKFLSLSERGVGLSRNTALMRATAELCLFADDDVSYNEDYENHIKQAFKDNPKADIILFNVLSTNIDRPSFVIKNYEEIKLYNCLKYGAVRIVARTEKLKQANIYFSLLFGGGAKYSSGEDSLFLAECIKNGLKVYSNPTVIGYVSQEDSTWFEGYTDKYFLDKGAFFFCLSKRWSKILCLQYVLRHYKVFNKEKSLLHALKLMNQGIKEIKK